MSQALVQMVTADLAEKAQHLNALAERIGNATGNHKKLVADVREADDSPHTEVQKYQQYVEALAEKIEAATKQINAWIQENVIAKPEDAENVDALKEEFKEGRTQYRATVDLLSKYLPGQDVNAVLQEAGVPEVKNLRGQSSGGNATGIRRPRVERIWINGEEVRATKTDKEGNEVDYTNFTLAAQALTKRVKGAKVAPSDLSAAAFAAAGTDDLSTLNGEVFDFYFEVNGSDGARENVNVKVQPKDVNA